MKAWSSVFLLFLFASTSFAAEEGAVARAKANYMLYCAGCHRPDGSGVPTKGVPSMINTLGSFLKTPAGRALLVQVPGARNAPISDADLAALTNWQIITFSKENLPDDFVPYTALEVGKLRAAAPLDVLQVRERILVNMHDQGLLSAEALEKLRPTQAKAE